MKVIYNITQFKKRFQNPVLAIGVFDGLHLGHQKLLSQVIKAAKSINGAPIVMTFHPHPVHVLHPEVKLPLIVTLQHRLKLLEDFGIKATVVVNFTKQFAKLSPSAFIKKYIAKSISPKVVYIGDDFRFGQDRQGSIESIEKMGKMLGFEVKPIQTVGNNEGKISSTQIRHYIIEGNLQKAQYFLGRSVAIMGKVIKGEQRGRKLGFPTANIIPHNSLIPPKGVYASRVEVDGKRYNAMTNIGQRPSFTPLNERIIIETHIFNFRKNIYHKNIIVEIIKKIRNEKVFRSSQALVSQLKKDASKTRQILRSAR